ncbi:MAG: hypothetical protein ACRD1D_06795 [Acidimicrobiales bacterium]
MRRGAAVAAVLAGTWVGPAQAQTVYIGVQPPAVGTTDAAPVGEVLSSTGRRLQVQSLQVQPVRGGLAFTGADILGLVGLGGGAIVVGAILKRRADAT